MAIKLHHAAPIIPMTEHYSSSTSFNNNPSIVPSDSAFKHNLLLIQQAFNAT